MLLNDLEIAEFCRKENGMISPYNYQLISRLDYGINRDSKAISYGQSSFGYDIRLAYEPIKIFSDVPGEVIDPKDFAKRFLIEVDRKMYDDFSYTFGNIHVYHHEKLEESNDDTPDCEQSYFILPSHSYALGVSVEKFNIPRDITAICLGKSTYARCGVFVNITPLESEWQGYLTIEIANISPSPCRIYLNEGIAQLLFFKGNAPKISYNDRKGKYQDQPQTVILPK